MSLCREPVPGREESGAVPPVSDGDSATVVSDLVAIPSSARSREPLDGSQEVLALLRCGRRVAGCERVAHAVAHVILEQRHREDSRAVWTAAICVSTSTQ